MVYVAPMKALAAEMTRTFGSRLKPLGLSVRELTGDMQLTKKEMMDTHVSIDLSSVLRNCLKNKFTNLY